MTDDLAARRAAVAARLERARQAKAEERVDTDCALTVAALEARAELQRRLDRINGLILGSRRRHPSNGRKPYDHEDENA